MCEKVNLKITSAIRRGSIDRVREIIDSDGLSYSEGYVLLIEAIRRRRLEIAKLLLINGCEVNCKKKKERNSNTPLGLAVANGYAEIVEMLLLRDADIHYKDKRGSTVIHTAVQQGNMNIIKLLLSHGADVHILNNNGLNPLHLASTKQCVQIVEDLLNHGAYINSVCISTRKLGYTPLHFSSEQGFKEAVKLFLSKGADVGATTWDNLTPLHIAVKAKRETVVKLLLEHGAKVDAQVKSGNTVLNFAVESGNSTIVQDVLKYGPDINNQSNRSSFKNAVCGSREIYAEIVDSLLRYGFIANPEDEESPELMCNALANGYLKIIEDLLKNGTDVNMLYNSITVRGGTLLHSAVLNKQDEVVKLLIDYGANVNAKTDWKVTPLFYAVRNSDAKITRLLLTNGADIKGGPELLQMAAASGQLQIVEDLLKCGIDVNMFDHSKYGNGSTLLHDAVLNKQDEVAKLLLNYRANINAKDETGEPPLYYAVENNDVKFTRMLLTNGADIRGDSDLLYLAIRNICKQIVDILLKHGVNVNVIINDRTPLEYAIYFYNWMSDEDDDYDSDYYDALEGEYEDFRTRDSTEILDLLKRHVAKLQVAGLYVHKKNLQLIIDDSEINNFQRECEGEIEIMKCEKISNSYVSFYDILTKNTNQLAIYANNENIVQAIKSADYTTKFSIYASMIEGKFSKGLEWKEVMELGNQLFCSLFVSLPVLPLLCIEKIFSYLSICDIKLLIHT